MKVLLIDIDLTLNLYDPNPTLQKTIGLGLDRYSKEAWGLFEMAAKNLTVQPHPIPQQYYDVLTHSYDKTIIITSRPRQWEAHTVKWLEMHNFHYDELFMRKKHDLRSSGAEVKEEIVKKHAKVWKLSESVGIDDDQSILDVYRKAGIKTFKAPDEWEKALLFHQKYIKLK